MFSLFNVVFYNGVDAYVEKYILQADTAKTDIISEFSDSAVFILKLDELYKVELDNIYGWKYYGSEAEKRTVEMFEKMYFT